MADQQKDLTAQEDKGRIGGGPGASDASNGAGNATGIPDAETGMRLDGDFAQGDVAADREKLFPEAQSRSPHPGETEKVDEKTDVDHAE